MHKLVKYVVIALFMFSLNLVAGNKYYMAASGGGTGTGTISSPWTPLYALDGVNGAQAAGKIAPGDTLYVRGGSYTTETGQWPTGYGNITLNGTATSPIVVRNYNNERASFTTTFNAPVLFVKGNYIWLWGIEAHNTLNDCIATDVGVMGTHVINCIVHDAAVNCISNHPGRFHTFIYGNIIYYGWYGYYGAQTDSSDISENFFLNNGSSNQGYQLHANSNPNPNDSTSYTHNYILGNAGATIVIGGWGNPSPKGNRIDSNWVYTVGTGTGGIYEYGQAGHKSPRYRGNMILGGQSYFNLATTGRIFTGNTVYGNNPQGAYYEGYGGCTGNWVCGQGNIDITSAGWTANSYYFSTTKPPASYSLRVNKYEPKRAHLVIWNPAALSSYPIDPSNFLAINDSFYVKDPQNYWGLDVAKGKWTSGTISMPMTNTTISAREANGYASPVHSDSKFQVFIITKVAMGGTVTPPPPSPPPSTSCDSFYNAGYANGYSSGYATGYATGKAAGLLLCPPKNVDSVAIYQSGKAAGLSSCPPSTHDTAFVQVGGVFVPGVTYVRVDELVAVAGWVPPAGAVVVYSTTTVNSAGKTRTVYWKPVLK